MQKMGKRAVIMGASSGLGFEISRLLLERGYHIGIAARRNDRLQALKHIAPDKVETACIDVTSPQAPAQLEELIARLGGIDLYMHVAGIGSQNMELQEHIELETVQTNAVGFVRMIGAAYRHMALHGGGHIAAISSIAGTKGLGPAPAYSATKALQSTYIEALDQQSRLRKLNISFTDIRPGFVHTDLLNDGRKYPMLMHCDSTARLIVKAVTARRAVKIVDWRYRLVTCAWKLLPRWLWVRMPISQ